jgi:DNA-binding NarL/FixJ family response regulator
MVGGQVRIVLVALPQLLREIVEAAIEAEPDMSVVGETEDESALAPIVEQTDATAVIAAEEALDEGRALELVGSLRIELVTLSADGRRAAVYECRPQRRDVGPVDAKTLAQLLKV